jgi:hypothetical protein
MNILQGLKENANAIVRLNQIDVTISSQRSMLIDKGYYKRGPWSIAMKLQ